MWDGVCSLRGLHQILPSGEGDGTALDSVSLLGHRTFPSGGLFDQLARGADVDYFDAAQ